MSNAGAIVAAVRLRKEREVVAFLKERGALSAAVATQLDPSSLMGKAALRSLVRNRAVIESSPGSYHLELEAYEALRSKRRLRIGILVVLALCVGVAVFLANSANP